MGRKQRECYLCGESYKYCGSCANDRMKPAYMSEFHSESCKNIFDVCTRFNMELMSKEEAKSALEKCDLTNKANFKSYVQRDLENIFAEDVVDELEVKENKAVSETKFQDSSKKSIHEVVFKR